MTNEISHVDNNDKDKINCNLYPSIDEIKNFKYNNNSGSLAFLKEFYVKVWGSYEEYVNNDLKLYDLFNKKNNNCKFILDARIALLDKMYGTQIKAIRKIIDIFSDKNLKGYDNIISKFEKIKKVQNKLDSQFNVRKEISFASKYFHWINEVDIDSTPTPIYDKNVRKLLEFYLKIKIKQDFNDLKNNIDCFISKLELVNENSRVDFDGQECKILYNKISIYRLVDKFMWLSYKIVEQLLKTKKTNTIGPIPIEIIISYLEFLNTVKNGCEIKLENLKEIKDTKKDTEKVSLKDKIDEIKEVLQDVLENLNTIQSQ